MNKYIKIILIVIGIIVFLGLIDFISVFMINRPLFSIKGNIPYQYKGILYDTYNCQEYSNTQIKFKGTKFACSKIDSNEVIDIKDTTKDINGFICLESLEQFYEDENYIYYYNCIKDKYVLVEYSNENKENVSKALKKGIITINDLDRYDIYYIKESKQEVTTATSTTTTQKTSTTTTTTKKVNYKNIIEIIDETIGMSCASAIGTFYEDEKYEYQFSCIKSEGVIVKYEDGTEENVKIALENGNIRITDLDKYNINYYKTEK